MSQVSNHMWRVWWSCRRMEAPAAHRHHKKFSNRTSALRVPAIGALVPFQGGTPALQHLPLGGLGSHSFPSLCAERSFCLVYHCCFLM